MVMMMFRHDGDDDDQKWYVAVFDHQSLDGFPPFFLCCIMFGEESLKV